MRLTLLECCSMPDAISRSAAPALSLQWAFLQAHQLLSRALVIYLQAPPPLDICKLSSFWGRPAPQGCNPSSVQQGALFIVSRGQGASGTAARHMQQLPYGQPIQVLSKQSIPSWLNQVLRKLRNAKLQGLLAPAARRTCSGPISP